MNIKTVRKALENIKKLGLIRIIHENPRKLQYYVYDLFELASLKNATCEKNGKIVPFTGLKDIPLHGALKENKETIEKTDVFSFDNGFEEFWKACPRKEKQLEAYQEWQKAAKNGIPPQELTLAMKFYADSKKGIEKKFIKLPSNWLKEQRWKECDFETIQARIDNAERRKKMLARKEQEEDAEFARKLQDPEVLKRVPSFAQNLLPQQSERPNGTECEKSA